MRDAVTRRRGDAEKRGRAGDGTGTRRSAPDEALRQCDGCRKVDSLFAPSEREEASDQQLIDAIANAPATDAPQVFAAGEILTRRLEARGAFDADSTAKGAKDAKEASMQSEAFRPFIPDDDVASATAAIEQLLRSGRGLAALRALRAWIEMHGAGLDGESQSAVLTLLAASWGPRRGTVRGLIEEAADPSCGGES